MGDEPTALGSIIDPWHESLYDAIREGDAESIGSLVAGDVILMPPNEATLKGSHHVRAWFEAYFKNFKIEELKETERSVMIVENWAFEWGGHALLIRPLRSGSLIEDQTRFLTVWQHQPDRRWRVSRMMWNSSRPLSATLNRLLANVTKPHPV